MVIPSEINTTPYTFKDDVAVTEAEKCLSNSCVTAINREEPEFITVPDSTEKTIGSTQFTDVKEVFTIPVESRTEYDESASPTTAQDYLTTQDDNTPYTSVSQDVSTRTMDETTFKAYTDSMKDFYPIQTPENKMLPATTETPYDNESVTQAFTVLNELTTIQPIDSKDVHQVATTIRATDKVPATDVTTEMPTYPNTMKTTLTPAIELNWPETATKSIVTSSVERPTDADYDETTTRNSTSFDVTETITFNATNVTMVTMTPSTIVPEQTDARVVTPADVTTSYTTEAFFTTLESKTTSAANNDDFTTVTDFHRTTFGTEIFKSEGMNIVTTTESNVIHNCTKDQCANTSLCLNNGTQVSCKH
jgi:hypothetical protein